MGTPRELISLAARIERLQRTSTHGWHPADELDFKNRLPGGRLRNPARELPHPDDLRGMTVVPPEYRYWVQTVLHLEGLVRDNDPRNPKRMIRDVMRGKRRFGNQAQRDEAQAALKKMMGSDDKSAIRLFGKIRKFLTKKYPGHKFVVGQPRLWGGDIGNVAWELELKSASPSRTVTVFRLRVISPSRVKPETKYWYSPQYEWAPPTYELGVLVEVYPRDAVVLKKVPTMRHVAKLMAKHEDTILDYLGGPMEGSSGAPTLEQVEAFLRPKVQYLFDKDDGGRDALMYSTRANALDMDTAGQRDIDNAAAIVKAVLREFGRKHVRAWVETVDEWVLLHVKLASGKTAKGKDKHPVVHTDRDQHKWEKAQALAEKAGKKDNWAYIMGIYKKMVPTHDFKSAMAIRVAKRHITEDTDIDFGDEEYLKTVPIKAVKMDEAFSVDTLEGKVDGKKGDWLAEGIKGERWPIDADIFSKTYKEAE